VLNALGDRFNAAGEMAGAQKAAAIAASAAAIAGGGVGVNAVVHDQPRVAASAFVKPERAASTRAQSAAAAAGDSALVPGPSPVTERRPAAAALRQSPGTVPASSAQRASKPTREFEPSPTTVAAKPAGEFASGAGTPGTAPASGKWEAPPASPAPAAPRREFGP
jgi:hypothetical protein